LAMRRGDPACAVSRASSERWGCSRSTRSARNWTGNLPLTVSGTAGVRKKPGCGESWETYFSVASRSTGRRRAADIRLLFSELSFWHTVS
jgi:hypothetical protein